MASKQSIIVASVLLIVFFVEQGSAIKCFECNSHYNTGCIDEDPTKLANFTVDCSSKTDKDERNKPIQYTICRKVLQVIEFSVNQLPANTRVIRSCGFDNGNYKNTCYKRHGTAIRCFECNSNIDIRCALAYPPSEFTVDCDDLSATTKLKYNYCRKISQVIRVGTNSLQPDSRVVRECGSNVTEVRTECYNRHGVSSHQSICECDISYCNGSDSKTANFFLFAATAVILATFNLIRA